MTPQNALTIKGEGILRAIVSKIGISLPFTGDPKLQRNIPIKSFDGVWDTGATGSVITKKVIEELGLRATGQKEVHTASGSDVRNTYLVNVYLPGNVTIQNVTVTEGILPGSTEVLIGMDVITLGDFSITNVERKTVMSFRIPSCERIDYVEEINNSKLESMNRHERRAFETQKRKGLI